MVVDPFLLLLDAVLGAAIPYQLLELHLGAVVQPARGHAAAGLTYEDVVASAALHHPARAAAGALPALIQGDGHHTRDGRCAQGDAVTYWAGVGGAAEVVARGRVPVLPFGDVDDAWQAPLHGSRDR